MTLTTITLQIDVVDIIVFIMFIFTFIIMTVILLEIYYFEKQLIELTGLLNHLVLKE